MGIKELNQLKVVLYSYLFLMALNGKLRGHFNNSYIKK
uniref:Uncharacterized protein n=1 Tax=Phage sp. ctnfz20 TaxID=2825798 RepID=A0A8S5P5H2_9VIRU|nr:MAG TPA: hypothetical protein [Phage sp. ctnfz20]